MRFRATILVKLLVALVLPVIALFTLFAFVAYNITRRDLEAYLDAYLADDVSAAQRPWRA